MTDDVGDVQNQRDAAVTHDGRPRKTGDATEIALQALHHHLLLADQLVHHQCGAAAFRLDDDGDLAALPFAFTHAPHRQVVVAHPQGAAVPGDAAQLVATDAPRFDHRGE